MPSSGYARPFILHLPFAKEYEIFFHLKNLMSSSIFPKIEVFFHLKQMSLFSIYKTIEVVFHLHTKVRLSLYWLFRLFGSERHNANA